LLARVNEFDDAAATPHLSARTLRSDRFLLAAFIRRRNYLLHNGTEATVLVAVVSVRLTGLGKRGMKSFLSEESEDFIFRSQSSD